MTSENRTLRLLIWLPVPLFLIAFAVLARSESEVQYGSPLLLISANFVFSAVTSLIVVFMVGRSFLLRSSPGLLLFCCGALLWGLVAIVSILVDPDDINTNVTVHNSGACLAALCHFLGVFLSIRSSRTLPAPRLALAIGLSVSVAALAFVARAAVLDLTPVFFIQGTGGTLIRQIVLSSAGGLFLTTALLLRFASRRSASPSAFVRWYARALVLIATGMLGVFLQSSFGGALNWTARSAMYVGGIYMLIAAVASLHDTRDWHESLTVALTQAKARYEYLFHLAADGILVCGIDGSSFTGPIVEANPALCELLGWSLSELRDMSVHEIIDPRDLPAVFSPEPGAVRREITLLARDGRPIPAEVTIRHFADESARRIMATVRDITERRLAEQRIQELADRLTRHVENSPLAVIESGPDLTLTRWSGEAERLFGWSAPELLGRAIYDLRWIHQDDLPLARDIFNRAQQGEARSFSTIRHRRADGTLLHCEWYISSLFDGGGRLVSILCLILDVTARVEAERDLRRVNADLEQFAYAVSHDLQEPLRTVSIYSELLLKRLGANLDPETSQYLDHVLAGARRMLHLLAGLRTYLHAGTAPVQEEFADAGECLRIVMEDLRDVLSDAGASVSAPPLPCVAASPVRLQQIFQNLIMNAVKFRSAAPPRIEVSVEPRGGMECFAVRDNGIGIDPRYSAQIFRVFRRLHPQSQYEGSGMGLAIVQRIVERYGGCTWVESELGAGAAFFFTLPSAESETGRPAGTSHHA